MKKPLILEIISCLLIILFFYAAVSKWVNFEVFKLDMHKQPLPSWLTEVLIWMLPPGEILIAVLIMMDRTRLTGFYCALLLMGAFTLYTAAAIFNMFSVKPCGCGGIIRELSWEQHLLFNLFFTALSFTGIIIQNKLSGEVRQSAVAT